MIDRETGSDNYIRELEKTIESLITENSRLNGMVSTLASENEELKRNLLMYENPHTPPSLQRFISKPDKTSGKRGAHIGHKGSTKVLGNLMRSFMYQRRNVQNAVIH